MENEVAARNKKIKHAIMIIVLTLLFIAFVFPFIMVIMNVFKVKADITANPLALIGKYGFRLENFPNTIKKIKKPVKAPKIKPCFLWSFTEKYPPANDPTDPTAVVMIGR